MLKTKKLSLTELALSITKKNIEKGNYSSKKQFGKKPRVKHKKTGFNIKKQKDGSFVTFLPVNMRSKGFVRKIENNLNIIKDFKSSNNELLKL